MSICAFLSPGTDATNCGRPCDHHDVKLRDRVGKEHPLKADVGCRNTLYNAVPQTAAEYLPRLQGHGARFLRIEFVDDSPQSVERTITLYRQVIAGEREGKAVWRKLEGQQPVRRHARAAGGVVIPACNCCQVAELTSSVYTSGNTGSTDRVRRGQVAVLDASRTMPPGRPTLRLRPEPRSTNRGHGTRHNRLDRPGDGGYRGRAALDRARRPDRASCRPADPARRGPRFAIRDKPRAVRLDGVRLTTDVAQLIDDPEVDIIIETMGGTEPACSMCCAALAAGKHVVTANKALLAEHGTEVFAAGAAAGRAVAFEGSVGGGIPIVQALGFALAANQVQSLAAIVNGTCNFILTQMTREGLPYEEALRQAQQLGYAEADPTLDVDGTDTAHKLAILAQLAFESQRPARRDSAPGNRPAASGRSQIRRRAGLRHQAAGAGQALGGGARAAASRRPW